jgi:hypothetical protein
MARNSLRRFATMMDGVPEIDYWEKLEAVS